MKTKNPFRISLGIALSVIIFSHLSFSQEQTIYPKGHPVIVDSDTLFYIYTGIGVFTAETRAREINKILDNLLNNDIISYDSIIVMKEPDHFLISLSGTPIMAVTSKDAEAGESEPSILAERYRNKIVDKLTATRELYSKKNLINNTIYSVVYFIVLLLGLFLFAKLFPWLSKKVLLLHKSGIKDFNIRNTQIVKSSTIANSIIIFLKGVRFVLTLIALYLFLTEILHLWPYTRKWELQTVVKVLILFVFYSVFYFVLFKSINSLISFMNAKYTSWIGTKIKTIRIKSTDLLSAERTVAVLIQINKLSRFALHIILFYLFITVIFSLFSFSQTWANKLMNYILNPLNTVWSTFVDFLPNLFFIIVLIVVFNYVIRFVKFIFSEINNGNIEFPGFHQDWATPTYKIVRFMILVLAAIVVFPYLPGSNSPFFQGISVFLGILFSLGSSSAIANMVSGVVLTYMRPFKLGDRVKIADTMGDVIEKTLLVTRVRTVKNVDITIPNAMVLSSHIINYSSSAVNKGLILHTTVTIGYDVPWEKVHELLISAANEIETLRKDPKPFVLQTSLDDFYVSYELNAYTNNPQLQALTYSELHSKIQDKFNEAAVEIMSPHYGAVRDGNQTTIPEDYLPKEYKAPPFRLFGLNFGNKNHENPKNPP
ncbi:MAG: mechanosensitive ion channel family protein [Ignavibacteriaceae bacterium]